MLKRVRGKPFAKGNSGRPKGSLNKGTPDLKAFWREFFVSEAWRDNATYRIIQGKAPHLETYLLARCFGLPPKATEDTDANVNVRITYRLLQGAHPLPVIDAASSTSVQ